MIFEPFLIARSYLNTSTLPSEHRPKPRQGDSDKYATKASHNGQIGPNHSNSSASIEDGLTESDKVCRRRNVHHVLQERRHALERSETAGKQEHDNKNGDRQQRKLRHRICERCQQDAQRRQGEKINASASKKQLDGTDDGYSK